ncbi:MAG TPA: maleylacetoacetate isomerase [Rhodanobacteraceae bacterium]
MDLYSFFASSTSYRVRIALHLKGVPFRTLPVNLLTLEQRQPQYLARNPAGAVPLLDDAGTGISQSLPIIEYLDSRWPEPRLLPAMGIDRIRVLEIANLIACDIQPLNGLRVLRYLRGELALDAPTRQRWYEHWIAEGFRPLEKLLERAGSGPFCTGRTVSLADCCLVPQVANALQHRCPMADYPRVNAVYAHCMTLDAFRLAAPDRQPDFAA